VAGTTSANEQDGPQNFAAVQPGRLARGTERMPRVDSPVHREQDSLERSLLLISRRARPSGPAPLLQLGGKIQPVVEPPVLLRAADGRQELLHLTG
jgi:hypothetical protein